VAAVAAVAAVAVVVGAAKPQTGTAVACSQKIEVASEALFSPVATAFSVGSPPVRP